MTICSLVIQANPKYTQSVNQSLINMEGVEIHTKNDTGKFAITIDHPSRAYCSHAMTDITRIDGVMSTALIFEYQEDMDEL